MEIVKTNINEVNAVIKIKIGKEDYSEKVQKALKDYRNKANIPGFRKGKVPMDLVNKMYGKAVLVDEVNNVLVDSLSKYLYDEKLPVLGEPLPSLTEQDKVDFENQTDFEFAYDVALAPEFDVNLTKKHKFPYYEIKIDDKLINEHMERQQERFGSSVPVDSVVAGDLIKGIFNQADADGNVIENGHSNENMFLFDYIKDEAIKAQFEGAKADDIIIFSPLTAFQNLTEVKKLLGLENTESAEFSSNYAFTVTAVERFQKAEVNQELFDKMYGEGVCASEEEARAKVKEELSAAFVSESDYKFRLDIKEKLVSDINFELPTEFLKRWMLTSSKVNKGKNEMTPERVENEWPAQEKELRWQLIKDKIAKTADIKVEYDEVKDFAKKVMSAQFAQYGMGYLPDEHMENYTIKMLEKEDQYERYATTKFEEKVALHVKGAVKLDVKEITTEEFNNFFKEN